MINDGRTDFNNKFRWVSDTEPPHQIELTWDKPQTVGAVRILSGQQGGGSATTPITEFLVQYDEEGSWKTLPGGKVDDNDAADWSIRFAPVRTGKLRLTVTRTPGDIARLWEIEAYGPVTP